MSFQRLEQLQLAIQNSTFNTSFKMKLLNWSTTAGSAEFISLIHHCSFSLMESKQLGLKVLEKKWKRVGDKLFHLRHTRQDLRPAILECLGVFGVLKRLTLKLEGFGDHAISENEWWKLLTDRAAQLYPYGPDQNGIWERAGGENSEILTHGTGKEKWHAGVQKVRIFSSPNVSNLIGVILEEFPNDDILIQLRNSL